MFFVPNLSDTRQNKAVKKSAGIKNLRENISMSLSFLAMSIYGLLTGRNIRRISAG